MKNSGLELEPSVVPVNLTSEIYLDAVPLGQKSAKRKSDEKKDEAVIRNIRGNVASCGGRNWREWRSAIRAGSGAAPVQIEEREKMSWARTSTKAVKNRMFATVTPKSNPAHKSVARKVYRPDDEVQRIRRLIRQQALARGDDPAAKYVRELHKKRRPKSGPASKASSSKPSRINLVPFGIKDDRAEENRPHRPDSAPNVLQSPKKKARVVGAASTSISSPRRIEHASERPLPSIAKSPKGVTLPAVRSAEAAATVKNKLVVQPVGVSSSGGVLALPAVECAQRSASESSSLSSPGSEGGATEQSSAEEANVAESAEQAPSGNPLQLASPLLKSWDVNGQQAVYNSPMAGWGASVSEEFAHPRPRSLIMGSPTSLLERCSVSMNPEMVVLTPKPQIMDQRRGKVNKKKKTKRIARRRKSSASTKKKGK